MKRLLYREQSQGYDGNQGWVLIYHGRVYDWITHVHVGANPEHRCGTDAQGTE